MKKPSIAILGATGVVGQKIKDILEERDFQFSNIKFLASARSVGRPLVFKGKTYKVEEALPEAFDGVDIVLSSAGASTSKALVAEITKRGCVMIDNTSAFRMDEGTPLVIVGVNDEDIKKHNGVIANPNCSTSQLMLAIKPLHDYATIKRMIVTTYQAVSGAGKAAIDELRANAEAILKNEKFENKVFDKQIAFNVIPRIDVFSDDDYTKEELKVVNETKKIMHLLQETPISCTAIRIPVYTGHSESVNIEFEKELTPQKAREILDAAYGVEVIDNPAQFKYPTPAFAEGKDPVYVGRIRKDLAFDNGLVMWVVADNLRIGAALNTVRIAEKLVEMNLIKN